MPYHHFRLQAKNFVKNSVKYLLIIFSAIFLISCTDNGEVDQVSTGSDEGVAYYPEKDAKIQRYNLEQQKKQAGNRTPCDALAINEFVLETYPEGSYLVNFDKTLTFDVPNPAVINYNQDPKYFFAVIAKSRPGERLIETKNIVGYDQSFIDLDSTELGTAFFYLTLFECNAGNLQVVWESLIPSHGGFNKLGLHKWNLKNTPYIRVNFHYGRGIGHIDYNYFLIDGLRSEPHIMMTYEGINFKRTIANVNNDKFPDYYEFIFYDLEDRVFSRDSVAFIWQPEESVYVNTRNRIQTRPY